MSHTLTRPSGRSEAFAGGLVAFAAVLMIVSGIFDVLRGIMGIAEDEVFVTTPDYVFEFDLTSWGWIHLVLGALAIAVGIGLLGRGLWARVLAVGMAALLIIVNFLSVPYYPVWSLVAIAFYVFVIWALCVVPGDGANRT